MENPRVTIVVPVYNVEQYLDQCLESLTKQTYSDIQIVLVDDGSTDSSGRICDVWSKSDARINVIHQANRGLSAARNNGLSIARGEYIEFVDSDDYVEKELIETLVQTIDKTGADAAIFEFDCINDSTGIASQNPEARNFPQSNKMSGKETLMHLLKGDIDNHAWRYLAAKHLFTDNGILFPENKHFEDIYTSYKVYGNANTIALVHKTLYHYRIRKGSILHSKNITQSYRDAEDGFIERGISLSHWYPELCEANKQALACWLIHLAWENTLKRNHKARKELADYIDFVNESIKKNISLKLLMSLPKVFILQYILIKTHGVYALKFVLSIFGCHYSVDV